MLVFIAYQIILLNLIQINSALNVSNLLDKYSALCGNVLCDSNLTKHVENNSRCPKCTCDISCIHYRTCCLDIFLQLQPKCIESTLLKENKLKRKNMRVLMINTCPVGSNETIKHRCEIINYSNEELIRNVSVTSGKSGLTYRNVYCSQCHNESGENVRSWNWEMNCPLEAGKADFNFLSSFNELFDLAKENNFSIYYIHKSLMQVLSCDLDEPDVISTCNISTKWQKYDSDVEYACETYDNRFDDFKNVFCYMCNPELSRVAFRREPDVHSLRNLFAFSNFERETKVEAINKKCNENQLFVDPTNECRNIKCYPGRIRTNRGCIPLLENATDLGYIISIGMNGTLVETIYNTLEFVKSIRNEFKTFLRVLLQTSALIETTYILSNLPCSASSKWENESHVWISLYQKIFLHRYVNRSLIEERLISLPNTKLNVSFGPNVQSFVLTKDENAYNLPTIEDKSKLAGKCFLKSTTEIKNKKIRKKAESIMHLHVNNLLLCEQIELNESEFTLNINTLKLSLLFVAIELNYDEYILISSNKARLCLNTIINLGKESDDQNTQNVLEILQIGCTCISVICLLCTFATYCFFPSLRTMPGKNNMCLIFSMFWAHFVFHFITLAKKSEIGCKVLGVLIHYFWLATFACLSVCSYHMYMVFTSKTGAHFSEKRQLMTYIIYSFVFPVIVVAANCVITASVSGDSAIGYGGHVCFLNEKIAFIVSFIIPITLICCSNLFFYISTSVAVARRPKVNTEDHNRVNQIHFTVYVKLFTITGISWIFQIIDSFLPMSVFSIIVSIMNTLQGAFIFASYILNKRVLQLYKNV